MDKQQPGNSPAFDIDEAARWLRSLAALLNLFAMEEVAARFGEDLTVLEKAAIFDACEYLARAARNALDLSE